jgi:PAS domain S-box-containing protein
MKDQDKTKQQLIAENEELRRRLAAQEGAEAERSRAAEDLRRSEAQWRSVAENAPLFVAVVDRLGKMESLNRFRLGFEPATVLGRPIYDFLQPEYHDLARKCLEHVFQTGEGTSYESVGAGPEGSVSDYVTDVGPVMVNGNIIAATLIARDITERKRAEEALRQSEQRLSLHFQQTPLAAIEWDTEARVTKWNPGAVRVLGYTEEEALGRHVSFIVPPHVREHVGHLQDALLTRTGGGRSTNENITKDGRTILCEWYNTPLVDADGKVVGAASLAHDITEQKRAETQLKQAHDELEQKVQERTTELAIFKSFAEAASQGFGMADLDGRTTYLNQTMCRLLGEEKPEDVVGKLSSDYYPEEFLKRREKEIIPAILDRGYWRGELTLRSRQGKLTPTIQHVFLVRDEKGQPCQFAVTILDITELKQAEAALQTSEQKYRTLVETSPDGVIMADLKGRVTYASGPVLEYFGAERVEDILGRNPLEFIAKEDHHRFLSNLRRTVEEGTTRDIEYTFLKQDGTHFPGEMSAAVIRDASGKPNALVAILRDVTERHRAQEALAQSEEKYRQLVETTGTGYLWRRERISRFGGVVLSVFVPDEGHA